MSKVSEEQLNEIIALIDNKEWEKAEGSLLKLAKSGDSRVYYYLGHIYDSWDSKKKDNDKASRYFSLSAESNNPVAGAFLRLSRIEKSVTHSIRILKKGLQIFTRSEALYNQLLNYTEPAKREEIYKEIIDKDCLSERINITMAVTHFDLKEYEKALKVLSSFNVEENWDRNILSCIRGFSLYETGKTDEASKLFHELVEEDLNHKLNYIPHFGLILISLNQDLLSYVEQLAEEIPLDVPFYEGAYPFLEPGPWGESYIDASEYFLNAIALTIKKSKKKNVIAAMRGLRGLFQFTKAFDSEPLEVKLQNIVRKDLEFAINVFPDNKEMASHLFHVFKESNPSMAWKYLMQYALHSDEDIHESDDFIEKVDARSFEDIYSDFKERSSIRYVAQKLAKSLLQSIIERLYRAKRYKDVLCLSQNFTDSQLAEGNVLFEIAYSYNKEDKLTLSRKFYELYLSTKGESNAALNNLGLIFEKTGNLLKAKELYQKAAQIDSEDEVCRRNLKRLEVELKKKGKIEYELQEAVEKYLNESPYSHKKILDFFSHRNQDGLIICSYRQAPQFLKMSGTRAVDFLNDLLSKKFFIKVTDHEYETHSNVYRLNPYLEPELAKIEESLKSEADLLTMCERLNIENLNIIGFNEDLLRNIAKISSDGLKSMLQRDIKENALAIILRQNKSALVLSGSIIEAVLTDRIIAKNITKYKIGSDTKTVLKMDINDLLEVAEKEKLIDATMAHLAHGVRGYRNLIHPGVEQRKATIQVNDANVELAWGIVKKLLNDIG